MPMHHASHDRPAVGAAASPVVASGAAPQLAAPRRHERSAGIERWYAVALQPHADALARAHLERQGFATFAPALTRTVRHARQFVSKQAPLFPGYLFVRLDLGRDRWRAVNGTRGVRGLLTAGAAPAPVPEAVMRDLLVVEETGATLPDGARLEIVAGPFTGLLGRLQRLNGAARVTVLLQLIGTELAVNVPRAAVRPAG